MYIPLTFSGALQKCLIASSSFSGMFISGGFQYEYHIFTASVSDPNPTQYFEVLNGSLEAQVIVVGGGGGGGSTGKSGGGGGGGQVKYLANQRFFKGTYNISVGRGGTGALNGTSNAGTNGESSSISGPNFTLAAGGGGTAGFSINGGSSFEYAGGTGCSNLSGVGGIGGGGAGTTGNGTSVNCITFNAGNGGPGFNISVANYQWSFGCGGGGGSSLSTARGVGCYGGNGTGGNGDDGYANTGNGGGGAQAVGEGAPGQRQGGQGGSGMVIIQYKVNDYCTEFFNETGSCDCRQITFDATNIYNQYPSFVSPYIYLPCGETQYKTGSVQSLYPITVCAVSNSFYAYQNDTYNSPTYGYASGSTIECSTTQSTCVDGNNIFTPNCSQSQVVAVVNTGNGYGGVLYYVGKNSTRLSSLAFTGSAASGSVNYVCAVSQSGYPLGIIGENSYFSPVATCYLFNHQVFLPAGGYDTTIRYRACGGAIVTVTTTSGRFTSRTVNDTYCIDTSFGQPTISSGTGTAGTLTQGGNCLTGSLLPNCGCP